MDDFGAPPCK